MADLIDRDVLMKKICGNECGSVCDEECENAMCNFYDYIMNAPSVNRWIPCSERMPEKDTDVIVCCYGSDLILTHDGETMQDAAERTHRESVSVTVGFIGSDGWYGADWFPMMVTPTYWMTLPEPPEGGTDNGNG